MRKKVKKRTTIVFDNRDREFLDRLISEGKESGIKSFLSKLFDIYRSMTIYDWKYPGECYSGISRTAFFAQENLQTLIDFIQKDKRREVGRKMGEAARISITSSLGLKQVERKNWSKILRRLRIFGYGDFILQKNIVIVRNPFIPDLEVLTGFLEGILDCNLKTRTMTPPIILEAEKEKV